MPKIIKLQLFFMETLGVVGRVDRLVRKPAELVRLELTTMSFAAGICSTTELPVHFF